MAKSADGAFIPTTGLVGNVETITSDQNRSRQPHERFAVVLMAEHVVVGQGNAMALAYDVFIKRLEPGTSILQLVFLIATVDPREKGSGLSDPCRV
ncbi:hypothetical protein C8D92_103103 [Tamilnaduibacter salinus]|uniref:Uncharacterized protein n=2 Tax=Tamilnaduibacter salinus TaxID=1484056 RepID=A0A2U1CY47_9GAMM|nr:hypothetical protein C8D92_103103 [Tamilnaduibacter salinus]